MTALLLVVALVAGLAGVDPVPGVTGLCRTEDSVGCVWVGPLQGNGRGRIVFNPR